MIELDVGINQAKFDSLMKQLKLLANDKEIAGAINKAAKKAADEARKQTVDLISAQYMLPLSELKGTIKTRKLRGTEPGAVMQITSGVFSLYDFEGVLPREVMPPAKGPVRARVKRDGSSELGHAFVAKMPSGHIGVFEREDSKRKSMDSHINELFGPSVPGMFGREKETPINTAVIKKAGELFNEFVITELERLLNG